MLRSKLSSVAASVSRRRFLQNVGLAVAAGVSFQGGVRAQEKGSIVPAGATALPRFAVISDIHFGIFMGGLLSTIKVSHALKNIFGKGRIDALFVVGDLTDGGKVHEYNSLLKVFSDKANVPAGVAVYFMMGNHDHYNKHVNTAKLYKEKLKQPLNQYAEIKGHAFITLSPTGSGGNDYKNDAKKFLSEKLEFAAKKFPGAPIFVFFHHPPLETCYGSEKGHWGTAVLTPILERYPQVVTFSGHSHFPIGDPRSIHQGKFTAVNDGSTTYTEVLRGEVHEKSIHPEGFDNVTEGLIVNVLGNGNVEIERWDTFRDEEILPRWLVEAPHDGSRFTYKGERGKLAPAFAGGIKPVVSDTKEGACVVTFPQAKDNEVVHHYLIEILDGEKVIKSVRKCSQFYLNSWMPAELYVVFSKLPVGKKLTARVTAIDSYKNKSSAIRSESFSVTA
ncbi:MAG: metallophosphoesterase [Puniceicoccales bacterium]|jgi:Icc-related predicted phosphoesterase|nr:metallophosphoesterase [Puniceicoccales bacterium]